MCGWDILCGISKVPFEIPHKLSYPYNKRCVVYWYMKIYELLNIFETSPGLNAFRAQFILLPSGPGQVKLPVGQHAFGQLSSKFCISW